MILTTIERLLPVARKAEHASRVQDWPTYHHWLNGHTLEEKKQIEQMIRDIRSGKIR